MTSDDQRSPADGSAPIATAPHGDDATVATPSRGSKAKPKGSELREITLKFRFSSNDSKDAIAPEVLHLHWIQLVQGIFGTDIQVFSNQGAIMPKIDTMRWTSAHHAKHYTVHRHQNAGFRTNNNTQQSSGQRNKSGSSSYIIHRVRTSYSFNGLKNNYRVVDFLKKHQVYLYDHLWTEDIWNTVQIGFILGLDPAFYSPKQAYEKMVQAITAKAPTVRIPKFAMVYCAPQVKMNNNNIRTKAYAIETDKSTSSAMTNLMKEVCRESHEFIPFQMRSKHPDAFGRIVCQQTHMLSQLRTIIISNVGSQVMFYLRERIGSIPGVRDIVSHPTVEVDGKYRIQVHKDDFKAVRANLMINIPDWYDQHVPQDGKASTEAYPGTPEVAPIPSDGYSSGEESYYAGSVASAMSYSSSVHIDDAQSSYEETMANFFPNNKRVEGVPNTVIDPNSASAGNLYLKAAQGVPPPPSSVTASLSPDEGLLSDLRSSRSEVEELRRQLHSVQASKDQEIADLRLEASKVKHDADLKLAEQKSEMEAKVEQQRMDFERQMLEQRHQIEMAARQNQIALEEKLQTQIAQALQSRAAPRTEQPHIATAMPVSPALTALLETQSQQLIMLTQMMANMSQRESNQLPGNYATPPANPPASRLKRSSEEIVDLTSPSPSHAGGAPGYDDRTKKQDSKGTPSAKENTSGQNQHTIPQGIHFPHTPGSMDTSMSVITPARTTPPPFASIHPPSLRRTPPPWAEPNSSPISNLALKPEFLSGPEDSMTSDIEAAQQTLTGPSDGEASIFSSEDVADIHAQHSHVVDHHEGPSSKALFPQTRAYENAVDSIGENENCQSQTTPGDHGPDEFDDEL